MTNLEYRANYGVIAYTRRGLGDPLLLLHGLYPGASRHEFGRNIRALQQHFTVYAVDLLGFGESDIPRISHTVEMHQHMIRDFIRDEIGAPVNLVASGMSCGIAARLGMYDDMLVNRITMLSPPHKKTYKEVPGVADWLTQFVLGTLAVGFTVYETAASRAGIAEFLLSNYHSREAVTTEKIEELWYQAQEANKMMPYVSALCGYFDVDLAHWLPYIRRPIQIIMGRDLMPIPEAEWFRPAQWSAGKRLDVVEQAKSFPHDEQSAVTNQLILDFMDGRLPPTAGTAAASRVTV